MAIHTDAFGRVKLTDRDARKFERQVTYGRPTSAAKESAKKGAEILRDLRSGDGKFVFKARPQK